MKGVSWNIYFNNYNIDERTKKIVELSTATSADVIMMQEVRHDILIMLISKMREKGYILPESDKQTSRVNKYGYNTLTFVKEKYYDAKVNIIEHIHTEMGRDILEVIINGFHIYNVHLESLAQSKMTREIQLNSLINLVKANRAIACGDFNIKDTIMEESVYELGTANTYFAYRFHRRNYSTRYDRVIYNPIVKCQLQEYLGNHKYDIGYCSDHNGLVFNFSLYLTINCSITSSLDDGV